MLDMEKIIKVLLDLLAEQEKVKIEYEIEKIAQVIVEQAGGGKNENK